jgi:hypothetical protein
MGKAAMGGWVSKAVTSGLDELSINTRRMSAIKV